MALSQTCLRLCGGLFQILRHLIRGLILLVAGFMTITFTILLVDTANLQKYIQTEDPDSTFRTITTLLGLYIPVFLFVAVESIVDIVLHRRNAIHEKQVSMEVHRINGSFEPDVTYPIGTLAFDVPYNQQLPTYDQCQRETDSPI